MLAHYLLILRYLCLFFLTVAENVMLLGENAAWVYDDVTCLLYKLKITTQAEHFLYLTMS